MKKTIRIFVCLSAVFTVTLFTSCSSSGDDSTPPAVVKPDLVFYGLTSTNSLVKYNANNSTTAISSATITGLQSGETILAIDFRPVTGQLYGLGSTSRLYVIHPASGIAKEIGVGPFAQVLSGTLTGFDFNPTDGLNPNTSHFSSPEIFSFYICF